MSNIHRRAALLVTAVDELFGTHRAICRVNRTPSLVPLVACAAGAVAAPIQTAPRSRTTTSTPPASRFRSGAAATTANSAGDRGIFTEQGHRPRRGTSRSVPDCQFIHSAHHSSDTSRRDNSSTTTGDHDRLTTRPSPPLPGPARRTDPRICPGHLIWMTHSAPTVSSTIATEGTVAVRRWASSPRPKNGEQSRSGTM
jgi:hypothetical protein